MGIIITGNAAITRKGGTMKIRDLSRLQKKVLDACMNGWFMSGEYTAMFDDHRRSFEADSPLWLYRDIERWYESHAANHGDSHLLVKCTRVG
jgi:hypothetical protein